LRVTSWRGRFLRRKENSGGGGSQKEEGNTTRGRAKREKAFIVKSKDAFDDTHGWGGGSRRRTNFGKEERERPPGKGENQTNRFGGHS